MLALTERLAAASFNSSSLSQELKLAEAAEVSSGGEDMDVDEWEEIEIGKGLALYNSVEIDRIKGMKRYAVSPVSSTPPSDDCKLSH